MLGKRGQSTLEYVIVLTAIIGVVIVFAAGFLKTKVKGSLEHVGSEMESEVKKIDF